jgi:hypothetical protein
VSSRPAAAGPSSGLLVRPVLRIKF